MPSVHAVPTSSRYRAYTTILVVVLAHPTWIQAATSEDYKVARESTFQFAEKPSVTRKDDRFEVTFATKGYCDVTVAVQDADGRIVRHLASGVLGDNTPPPFRKSSKRQTLTWDGKDDLGRDLSKRVGGLSALSLRVSLGLKARFERTHFWHPKKRVGQFRNPRICAQPEGVYVYEGAGVETVRLYDHGGNYIRTIRPFPAEKIPQVKGLEWTKNGDGQECPEKLDHTPRHFLPSGMAGWWRAFHQWGSGITSFAVGNGHIVAAGRRLERMATDGSTGPLDLKGPNITLYAAKSKLPFTPHAAALSPDGKTLYLTAYHANARPLADTVQIPDVVWMHGVYRMELGKNEPPVLWKGKQSTVGKDNEHFNKPSDVTCDMQGRVYVSDHMNDRVQVYSQDGEWLRSLKVNGPAQVRIHHQTGEIYVFTWRMPFRMYAKHKPVVAKLQKFGLFDDPKLLAEYALRLKAYSKDSRWYRVVAPPHQVALDSWTNPPTIWLIPGSPAWKAKLQDTGIQLFVEKNGRLERKADFHQHVSQRLGRLTPPALHRQRLYVNPESGKLYLAEGDRLSSKLLEIDPEKGDLREVSLPMAAEDFAFGGDGLGHLKTDAAVIRYDPANWRESPFRYGEEIVMPRACLVSAIVSGGTAWFHHGGMDISPTGSVAVASLYAPKARKRIRGHMYPVAQHLRYRPRLFPGRTINEAPGSVLIHVWGHDGRLKHEDAVPGIATAHGVGIDANDDIYVLVDAPRVAAGNARFHENTATLIKFRPGKGRIISTRDTPIKLTDETRPKRPTDLGSSENPIWVEGAEWMYGGVGWGGIQLMGRPYGSSRFALDYFGRSFAPEVDRYHVAVLDSNGNVVLRIGKYGNVDDGKPMQLVGGPPKPRSIGGDEVALIHGAYVATHTDRRLFIADTGNGRILSVKLGYHAEATIPLKAE